MYTTIGNLLKLVETAEVTGEVEVWAKEARKGEGKYRQAHWIWPELVKWMMKNSAAASWYNWGVRADAVEDMDVRRALLDVLMVIADRSKEVDIVTNHPWEDWYELALKYKVGTMSAGWKWLVCKPSSIGSTGPNKLPDTFDTTNNMVYWMFSWWGRDQILQKMYGLPPGVLRPIWIGEVWDYKHLDEVRREATHGLDIAWWRHGVGVVVPRVLSNDKRVVHVTQEEQVCVSREKPTRKMWESWLWPEVERVEVLLAAYAKINETVLTPREDWEEVGELPVLAWGLRVVNGIPLRINSELRWAEIGTSMEENGWENGPCRVAVWRFICADPGEYIGEDMVVIKDVSDRGGVVIVDKNVWDMMDYLGLFDAGIGLVPQVVVWGGNLDGLWSYLPQCGYYWESGLGCLGSSGYVRGEGVGRSRNMRECLLNYGRKLLTGDLSHGGIGEYRIANLREILDGLGCMEGKPSVRGVLHVLEEEGWNGMWAGATYGVGRAVLRRGKGTVFHRKSFIPQASPEWSSILDMLKMVARGHCLGGYPMKKTPEGLKEESPQEVFDRVYTLLGYGIEEYEDHLILVGRRSGAKVCEWEELVSKVREGIGRRCSPVENEKVRHMWLVKKELPYSLEKCKEKRFLGEELDRRKTKNIEETRMNILKEIVELGREITVRYPTCVCREMSKRLGEVMDTVDVSQAIVLAPVIEMLANVNNRKTRRFGGIVGGQEDTEE